MVSVASPNGERASPNRLNPNTLNRNLPNRNPPNLLNLGNTNLWNPRNSLNLRNQ